MSNLCAGFVVSRSVWTLFVGFGVMTAAFLVWPRHLQRAYVRLATQFPRVAALDPGRSLMSQERNIWLLRLMGLPLLAVWISSLFLLSCYFSGLVNS